MEDAKGIWWRTEIVKVHQDSYVEKWFACWVYDMNSLLNWMHRANCAVLTFVLKGWKMPSFGVWMHLYKYLDGQRRYKTFLGWFEFGSLPPFKIN